MNTKQQESNVLTCIIGFFIILAVSGFLGCTELVKWSGTGLAVCALYGFCLRTYVMWTRKPEDCMTQEQKDRDWYDD